MDTMRLMSAAALAAVITGAAPGEPQAASGPLPAASAAIMSCGEAKISGTAFLFEEPSAEGIKTVQVILQVQGLPPGAHALHIHETGACAPCSAAGGHFDPGPSGNPSPDGNHPFHSGDLINIQAGGDSAGTLATATTRVTLSPGPLSLFDTDGSALIIHDKPDTYCPGGEVAGCAGGARIACGIIKPRPLD